MAVGTGLFLAAIGAILIWAVEDQVEVIDLTVAGAILLTLGLVTGLAALLTHGEDHRPRRALERDE